MMASHFAVVVLLLVVSSAMASDVTENLAKVAMANTNFGLQLLHQLEVAEKAKQSGEPANLLISPFSVSSVLTMLMAGAANETNEEIRNVLGFSSNLTDSDACAAYSLLFQQLNGKFSSSEQKNELQVANSIAVRDKLELLQSYLDVVANNFDSKIFKVDFANKAADATELINSWVANKTNGKIPTLFEQALSPATQMVLLNAIYFKGAWKFPFDVEKTQLGEFKYSAEKSVNASMMYLPRQRFNYESFDDGELLELPYENDSFSMLIFLPSRKEETNQTVSLKFAPILSEASSKLAARQAAFRNVTINVVLPRFTIKSKFTLKSPLQAMGMQSAFSGRADFSRINGGGDLVLANVHHKTHIEVNEEGSVAAGVTAAVVFKKSGSRTIVINRPFLFMIRDNTNHLTLFAGIVNKP